MGKMLLYHGSIVNQLGKKRIRHIFELADIYHSDNIERVSEDFIREASIKNGSFDNVADCEYAVPSYRDIGKVYKRLILMVADDHNPDVITTLMQVYNSDICKLIEDYNSSFYYDNPQTIFATYQNDCSSEKTDGI